mmetsp:Transcript_22009/g.32323  ORF Transcript_22009/g.32323 Transcript_22009/m.32323 type:complete len:835 (+) Transcript_22009:1036-3540(+)
MAEIVSELEEQIGVDSCDDDATNCEIGGATEGEDRIKAEFEVEEITEDAVVEEHAPASTSRYGRARAVPNFARMVDPLAQRAHNPEAPAPRAAPSNGGSDDMQATATQNMIELVKIIVSQAPKAGATIASPAGGAVSTAGTGQQDKYVGVRIKQNGYGAVIKKNHSEINLGTFTTPEEAARAYDMAALICQGDRAKVNFLDSWDIVQQYDTSAIREPFRDHLKESQREHMVSVHATHQQTAGHGVQMDFTPLTYDAADTSKPSSLGRLLNDFADRFPYAAVRDLDPAVWEVFTERNTSLSSFSEFGSQLLWLTVQVTDAAMRDSWGLHKHGFEEGCRTSNQGDKCVELLKKFDQHGIDWDKVGSLWEIDDGDGGDLVGRRGGLKRKRAGECDGREKIEDFLQLNWHILSDYERDGTKALQLGIEPTLALMRSHRQASKPVVEERPKRLPPPVQAVKIEAAARRPIPSNIVPATKAESPIARPVVERRPVREREIEKDISSAVGSSKSKGMTCSFCGKVFSHAPAHLQHERAHLQQQATKNPSSRIFQHMSPSSSSSSKSSSKTGRCGAVMSLGSSDGKSRAHATAHTLKEIGANAQGTSKVCKVLLVHDDKEMKVAEDECLVEAPNQDSLDRVDSHLQPRSHDDQGDEHIANRDDDLGEVQLDSDEEEDEEDAHAMNNEDTSQIKHLKLEEAASSREAAGVAASNSCVSKSCVEQGVPCPPCAKHNKGIAACFAQGHLYMTLKGQVPSSCKECKQRNKGALFCFKRGHMHNLQAMLGLGVPHCGHAVSTAMLTEAAMNDQDMADVDDYAEADCDDNVSGPVSGPVSPAHDECTL